MTRFKVLLVTPLANFGGTELSTLTLATGLKEAGHEVYVMCNAHPLVDEFTKRGIAVVLAGMQRNPVALIRDASRMRRCIAENKIEVIHFQSALPITMVLFCVRTIREHGAETVWTCRGIKGMSYPVAGHLFNHLISFVIANCNAERDRLLKHGLSPHKVTTIYNTPNITVPRNTSKNEELLTELGIDSDTSIVGTASRLAPDRGVQYFVEAAALISGQISGVKFIIAGGGPQEQELRQQAAQLGVAQQMVFLGPRRDMERVYSAMDVFVNPNPREQGTGNTNAEAMVFGKPVIAVNSGGTPEIVRDGVTGILVPPRDSEGLAQAALRLLGDRELAKRMGLAGRDRVMSDFSMERLVHEVEQVYGRVSQHGSPP
ncbi:MAG: glycosyltransferase family 4 protein [Chloroflexi bacterium]|nr:glycosyltransferase family 4 protein [Chloroflexota bacterium]